MDSVEFFEVPRPISREALLGVTREALESSLLIFAPFGLPR